MSTSVSELKERLRSFLSDPALEQEFRSWFALVLRDSTDPDTEALAHVVQRAFSDAATGHYTPDQLTAILSFVAKEAGQREEYEDRQIARMMQPSPKYIVTYVSGVLVGQGPPPDQNVFAAASGRYVFNEAVCSTADAAAA